MNASTEPSIFHVRSSRAVISAGYKLYMSNFKTLFRRTWPFAIGYALVIALMMYLLLHNMPQLLAMMELAKQHKAAPGVYGFQAILQLGTILYYLAGILLTAPVFTCLAEHLQTGTIAPPVKWYQVSAWPMTLRMVCLLLCYYFLTLVISIAIIIVIGIVLVGVILVAGIKITSAPITIAVFSILIGIAFLALYLPLFYTTYKYLLTPKSRFVPVLKETYKVGLRHWGSIFLVLLMVGIITQVISSVVILPYNILAIAITKSVMGVALGDPVGMPDYMGWMSFIVFSIAGFVLAYLHLSVIFPFYYLYGSIEKQEEEKKEMMPINTNLPQQ